MIRKRCAPWIEDSQERVRISGVRVVASLDWQRKRLNDATLPNDEIENRIDSDRRVLLGETLRDAAVFRENLDSREKIKSALGPGSEDRRRRTGEEDP